MNFIQDISLFYTIAMTVLVTYGYAKHRPVDRFTWIMSLLCVGMTVILWAFAVFSLTNLAE